MIQITFSKEISDKCPNLHVLAMECSVRNSPSDEQLWQEIEKEAHLICQTVQLDQINKWSPIRATRQAYKCFGKDPNRYRPSAESLRRRILRALPLYRVDTLVDLINLVSIHSGYSIGGFDKNKIQGGKLMLGVGKEGELYHGIGRGILNIAGLPVYRDETGGIGTPTSDEERTKIALETTELLMIINGYSGLPGLIEAGEYAADRLRQYASTENINAQLISSAGTQAISL